MPDTRFSTGISGTAIYKAFARLLSGAQVQQLLVIVHAQQHSPVAMGLAAV